MNDTITTENRKEENTKDMKSKSDAIAFTLAGLPIYLFAILSFILYTRIRRDYPEELTTLNYQFGHVLKLILILPTFLFMVSLVIYYEGFQRAGLQEGEKFQLHKIDYQLVLQEIIKPTKRKYKIRRVILIVFLVLSFLLLLSSQIFFYASI